MPLKVLVDLISWKLWIKIFAIGYNNKVNLTSIDLVKTLNKVKKDFQWLFNEKLESLGT